MDAPVTPHAVIPTGIVTLHLTLTTSPMGATHATPWTRARITPASPTTQHQDLSPGRSNNAQDPQHPIKPTAPNCHHPGFPHQTLHQILTVTDHLNY